MTKSLRGIIVAIVFLLAIILLVSCTGVSKKGCANCGEIFPVNPVGGGLKGGGGGS